MAKYFKIGLTVGGNLYIDPTIARRFAGVDETQWLVDHLYSAMRDQYAAKWDSFDGLMGTLSVVEGEEEKVAKVALREDDVHNAADLARYCEWVIREGKRPLMVQTLSGYFDVNFYIEDVTENVCVI